MKKEVIAVENEKKSACVTMGNNTYLPVNFDGHPVIHAQFLLQKIDAFEKRHPELEVVSWRFEMQPGSVVDPRPHIFGIWIVHRPKRFKKKGKR